MNRKFVGIFASNKYNVLCGEGDCGVCCCLAYV